MFTMIHIDACDNAMSVDYEDKNSCFIWIEWDNRSLKNVDMRH